MSGRLLFWLLTAYVALQPYVALARWGGGGTR